MGKAGGSGSLDLSMGMVGGSFLDDVGAGDGSSLLTDLASPLPVMSPGTGLAGGQVSGGGSNQVSYGDMVACDNADCPYEWFHYPCVGVTAPPKGKWYCQPCQASMRRRGRK